MQTVETTNRPLSDAGSRIFDEDGFLLDHRLWSPDLARDIAENLGVGDLTEKHWRVLEHVRQRFFMLGGLPDLRRVCRATSLSRAELYHLFGGCLTIWRLAGLPNPGEEAKTYLI